jgi:anti-sigma B factor antagonist
MSSALTAAVQQLQEDRAVVALAGAMDFESTGELSELLLDLLRRGHRHLVLEMSEVGFCDSSGLSALVRVLRQAKADQGSLALVAPTEPVERLLLITEVSTVISRYPTVELALRSSS